MIDAESTSPLSLFMGKLNEKSLLILKDGQPLLESRKEGMKPLLAAIRCLGRTGLRKTVVVDKIVGKAAALLIAYFQPEQVYCGTLSRRAEAIFKRYGLSYKASRVVPEILCRTEDDLCPFEKAVLDLETPVDCYNTLMLKVLSFGS
jgi:hypothetical protein